MCTLREVEYEKVHSYKFSKEMWYTLALAYEDHENIDQMFERFQTIINNLRSLCKTYDNYDHIMKILQSFPRQWRPQVTTLRASKDLKKVLMEELVGTLKVYEIELNKANNKKKGSSYPLKHKILIKAYRPKPSKQKSLVKKPQKKKVLMRMNFLHLKKDSLHKRGSKWKKNTKKCTKETKDNSQVVYYECKKLGHFKLECPSLEKEKEKAKKNPFFKKKKGLIVTWEELDLSS
ncbi:hypothetical protein CR513_52073, partial [Mucuna pruriens]